MDPFTATALAVGVASAATSAAAASKRNSAVNRSEASEYEATRVLGNQQRAQADQAKLIRSNESARLRALATVQASARGVATDSGSVQLWKQQALIDEARNRSTIDINLQNQSNLNTSRYNAAVARLDSERQSVAVQGVLGGLQGFSTGLSIGHGLKDILGPGSLEPGSPLGGSSDMFDTYQGYGGLEPPQTAYT